MNAILDWIGAYDWHLARLNAVVLEQSAPCRLSKVSRDVAMAENVAALLELEGPTSKAVLWAHNGHAVRQSPYLISDKAAPNMGSHLDELFGHQHRVQSRIVSGARAGAGSRCPHGSCP